MSNHATKYDLKNKMGVDTSKFAKKADLASLKSEIDKLDIDQLETLPVDLTKLSDVVKMKLFKKLYMMNWLNKLIPLILVDILKKKQIVIIT